MIHGRGHFSIQYNTRAFYINYIILVNIRVFARKKIKRDFFNTKIILILNYHKKSAVCLIIYMTYVYNEIYKSIMIDDFIDCI